MNITLRFTPPLSDRAASFRALAEHGIFEGLGRLVQRVEPLVSTALDEAAPRRTGDYASRIHSVQNAHGDGSISLEWRAPDPLSTFILEGTKPHEIVPVNAKVLAFMGADGSMVFTRKVNHPGTAPNDFVSRAWEAARGSVYDELAGLGRDIIEQVR